MGSKIEPVLSIIMPAYNAEKYISEAIESIINQTYTNWELLICDDNSTDKTYEIAKSFMDERIKLFKNPVNKKKPKTTNWLFTKSKGEIITIHDADDISHPLRFEKQINQILKSPNYFCGCDMQYIKENGKLLNRGIKKINILNRNYPRVGDATLVFYKSAIDNGVIYRDFFSNNMDYDFGLRLLKNYSYKNVNEYLYYYRNVPFSISKNHLKKDIFINPELVRYFHDQRTVNNIDSLDLNNFEDIENKTKNILIELQSDKSALERKAVGFLLNLKMNKTALRIWMVGWRKDYLNIDIYKNLLWLIRNTFLRKYD
ncbi:hypothetical protein MATR_01610 [Marivirga tractuosa]|uniref:Glycosyl transferase family 2 n=1 Tax=Marivirga tractuosa (strain ATCC 23168 / DSM 4126 / NBRC 15989 / NCIMB 1408 / VKM B-1430 / H-43) TaxID=643867 RepID=E4TVV0_MARTH|nr:glycosyltransferase family A protein [Marivirga tractuosa]ADR22198.1 glycosyl transferase family 2 [Marivirga tractuosa DSM 4126]BDD13336.1 hypothetical protein MATR_01610 [Marivirga tractuosa]